MPARRAIGSYVCPGYYAALESAVSAAVNEAAATAFESLTGKVRFYIKFDKGIYAVAATPTDGGTGYTANDILTVTTGDGNGQVEVLTVDGSGVVLTLDTSPVARGSGYSAGAGQATSGGTGTGCTVELEGGLFTDEVLTIYTKAEEADTVFIASPCNYGLTTSPIDESKFSGTISVGQGWHKAVLSGSFTAVLFDVLVKDVPV